MPLFLLSFLAGMLTILAPCVLPILPVVIGGSVENKDKSRPYIIISSFLVSTLIFTIFIQLIAEYLFIPRSLLTIASGGILSGLGVLMLFPQIWDFLSYKTKLSSQATKILSKSQNSKGILKPILIGLSLGPIFSSCSPTFSIIVSLIIFENNFLLGFLYSLIYLAGLAFVLIPISILGKRLISKLKWASDPEGWFKKILGGLFLIIGITIILGIDKALEEMLLNSGYYDGISNFENTWLNAPD